MKTVGTDADKIAELATLAEKHNVKFLRLQFVDIFGSLKNVAIPIAHLSDSLTQGTGFDGSSIKGFTPIHDSDMIAMPDPNTWAILPWRPKELTTARMICDIMRPGGRPFEGDPRYILKRAIKKATDMGYTFLTGPELEFFLVSIDNGGCVSPMDSGGYFDMMPMDMGTDVRRAAILAMEDFGLEIEMSHHEVAPGQHEIDFRYAEALEAADKSITYKQATKAMAAQMGMYATFMPKPYYGENGSGMHVHQSLFTIDGGKNAFFDASADSSLSDVGKWYIGGLLKHAKALAAVVAPTINSYKRLVPGYEAPVYISWAFANRSALVRVPNYHPNLEKAIRAEFRCPDVSCNPYLAYAVMLIAGLDGIKNQIEMPESLNCTGLDIYEFTEAELTERGIETLPGSLGAALDELEKDSVIREALGDYTFNLYLKLKRAEVAEYEEFVRGDPDHMQKITQWEIDKYLIRV
jgi:glutamine synthetase